MTRQLYTRPGPSQDITLYTLIASVEPNHLGFTNYMKEKGIPVQEHRIGSKADYTSVGIDLIVGYVPAIKLMTSPQQGEVEFELGTLVILYSSEGQDIVEEEAKELLKSIKEVEDPASVQILVTISRIAPNLF